MDLQTAYIVSLKFAPGLKKEFMVLGENIRKKGINVKYLLSKRYAEFKDECDGAEYVTEGGSLKGIIFDFFKFYADKKLIRIFSACPPFFICFYNPHPLNPLIARLVKRKFPGSITALYLHDPYKPDKRPYGKVKTLYITLVEFVQGLTVRYMNHVICPSEYSFQLFNKHFPKFKGELHIAPLLVPDQRTPASKKPMFFSMVGAAHPATGHDTFIELVNYVAEKELGYRFAFITSSEINKYLEKLSTKGQRIVKIINKKVIQDSEINEIIAQSYAVFRLDREVTQSGVVPVAFMNETPLIARNIKGLRQHVIHKHNGFIVPFDCKPTNLLEAMDFVKEYHYQLSTNSRMSYEEIWAEWNWAKYYGWLEE